MSKTVESALIGGAISFLTALLALWAQPEVAQFSDISEVAYATATIGGILAGLRAYKDRGAQP